MQIDRSWCLETLRDLVRIDSVNPSLVPGAAGEGRAAAYVAERLRGVGLEVERHEPLPGRISVTGRLVGSGGGKHLMLNGHLDTVDVAEMADPFGAQVRDGRLYGRGAFDMKGAVAACMTAAKALTDQGIRLRGDLVVAAVADEEYGSCGTADLAQRVRVDGAIVTEPTGLRLCIAHKGYLWIAVEIAGRAAHGSRFEEGIDANLRMGRFLGKLARLEADLRRRPPHPLVGPPSLHAATLRGGTGLSTYAALARVEIERRTVPGESEASVMAEITGLVAELQAEDPTFEAAVDCFFVRDPFEGAASGAVAGAVSRAAFANFGAAPPVVGDTPWMDSALLAAVGVDTVVFGPTGHGAHAAEEWVDLESVYRTAEILAMAAAEYCA